MNLSTVYALAAAALFGASTPLAKSLGLGICLQPGSIPWAGSVPTHLRQSVADDGNRLDRLDRRTDGAYQRQYDPPALWTWINEDGPDVVGMLQLALKL